MDTEEHTPFNAVIRISHDAWSRWLRFDQPGLEAFMKKAKLIVRVPVERQKKPKGTMG